MPNPLLGPILRWLGKLSYPRLFLVAAVLFVVDLVVPDVVLFADENAARPRHAAAGELETPQGTVGGGQAADRRRRESPLRAGG